MNSWMSVFSSTPEWRCDMTKAASDLLTAVRDGDPSKLAQLVELVYDDLRRLAQRYMEQERTGHTLQPTALVHEAFLKLIDQTRVDWRDRSHFFAVGAQAMRRILVNHAKGRRRAKRGGGKPKLTLDEALTLSLDDDHEILALDEALEKLAAIDERRAKIIELRFFGGLNVEETAAVLGISKRTVEREWTACRAWLRRELTDEETS
jgi:RNA polymerase sigma-70 factor, ECF subfamily